MKINNVVLIAGGAVASYYLFPQVQEFLVGGENSAVNQGGVSATTSTNETKKNSVVSAITAQSENLTSPIYTSSYSDGASSSTRLTTDVINAKFFNEIVKSSSGRKSDTLVSFTKKGQVVGGLDFNSQRSITAAETNRLSDLQTNTGALTESKKVSKATTNKVVTPKEEPKSFLKRFF